MDIAQYTGLLWDGSPALDQYVVSFTRPISNQDVSFAGWLFPLTWELKRGPCLLVGSYQAGPTYRVENTNDSVIEGVYTEYEVDGLYETDFRYSEFGDRC